MAIVVIGLTCQARLAQAGVTCPLVVAGDFPLSYIDGHPWITLKVDGKTLNMMVDSGAGISSITNHAWQALGGPPFRNIDGHYATGLGGNVQLNTGLLEDVDTGHAIAKNQAFIVTDIGVPSRRGKQLADGVLGYDFLENFDIGFDFPDDRFSLYFYQHCNSAQAPWAGDYDQEPLTVHPDTLDATIPYVIDGRTFEGEIDSGAEETLVVQAALDRAGIEPAATANFCGTGFGVGGLKFAYRVERFDDIGIGAEEFSNVWLRVGKIPTGQFSDLMIGEDYLSTHRVFISNSTQTVLLGLFVTKQN
jgi:predicted aspartyl protease